MYQFICDNNNIICHAKCILKSYYCNDHLPYCSLLHLDFLFWKRNFSFLRKKNSVLPSFIPTEDN